MRGAQRVDIIANPYRSQQKKISLLDDIPRPSTNWQTPAALLGRCPAATVTPLLDVTGSAPIARISLKDERQRMGLGSFKALGAAYVIARNAQIHSAEQNTYITASAGNHGLSLAAGAQVFGAKAVIYLSETVPASFADRLRDLGAEVRIEGRDYQESMDAALAAAQREGFDLISDSSWEGYLEPPFRVMEGYTVLMSEIFEQITAPPTHIFLQAGVGGLAAACAACARSQWGDAPIIVIVEPDAAPALMASIQAGKAVTTTGPVSNMGRLDCKDPSLIALKGLAEDADYFCTLSDAEALTAIDQMAQQGLSTSPSGGAGLAALMLADQSFDLTPQSHALCILSEGPA